MAEKKVVKSSTVDDLEKFLKLALVPYPDFIIQNPNFVENLVDSYLMGFFDEIDDESKKHALEYYDKLVKLGEQREKLVSDDDD